MKRQSAVAAALLLAGVPMQACTSSEQTSDEPVVIDSHVEELIGGVPANSAKLDAIGTVGFLSTYTDCWSGQTFTQYSPFCTASLISAQTVVTAKHCIDSLRYYGDDTFKPVFAIGANGNSPKRTVDLADLAGAPGDEGGLVGYGRDVAVVHLAETVTNIKPLKFAQLTESAIGSRYGAIGYGVEDNNQTSGRRLAGSVRVNALSGRIYELIFGSYEAFKAWYLDNYYDGGGGSTGGVTGGSITGGSVTGGSITGGNVSGGSDTGGGGDLDAGGSEPDGGGSPIDGGQTGGGSDIDGGTDVDGGATGGGQTGGPTTGSTGEDDWLDQYLREIYNNTYLMDGYETYVGNSEGDAQPCFGDSGSPLVKANAQGELVAYAVTSGGIASRDLICDFGGVYAAFGPEVVTFLEDSKNWQDPCNGVSTDGVCDGDTASRCTALDEGKRRLTVTDCSLFGQTCAVASNGVAMCIGEGEDPVIIDDNTCPDLDGGVGSTGGSNGGTTGGVDPGSPPGSEAVKAKLAEIRARAQKIYVGPLGNTPE